MTPWLLLCQPVVLVLTNSVLLTQRSQRRRGRKEKNALRFLRRYKFRIKYSVIQFPLMLRPG